MAVTGINLTALIRQLLQINALKMHFYNTISGTPTIDNFHHDDFEAQLMMHLHSEEANLDKLDIRSFE
ncbi:unnamed protein product [Brugia pahangi]|uniref:DUF4143 domain-containing protein n=1 Tax=Brugia pahangi TaxID=6280 RepID=A0A0N4TH07_BRUPA|nr:unnamed protein product [Brugia pahangi]